LVPVAVPGHGMRTTKGHETKKMVSRWTDRTPEREEGALETKQDLGDKPRNLQTGGANWGDLGSSRKKEKKKELIKKKDSRQKGANRDWEGQLRTDPKRKGSLPEA